MFRKKPKYSNFKLILQYISALKEKDVVYLRITYCHLVVDLSFLCRAERRSLFSRDMVSPQYVVSLGILIIYVINYNLPKINFHIFIDKFFDNT